MNDNYLLYLVDKVWTSTEDIQKLCNCSRNSAMTIRREVEEIVKSSGKRLPISRCKVVPTKIVLDYLSIDINDVLNRKKSLLEVK